MVERREFLQWLAVLGVAPQALWAQKDDHKPPPGPVPWMDGIRHANPKALTATSAEAVADGELRFFTPKQMQTLVRLSDVMLPAGDGFPSANDAGTPIFLDFLMSESSSARKSLYKGGIDWLEQQSMLRYKMPFAKTSDAQADALLRPWLRTWMTDHLPVEPHADFVNTIHYDMRIATENSEVWSAAMEKAGRASREQLYWSPVDPLLTTASQPLRTTTVTTRPTSTGKRVSR